MSCSEFNSPNNSKKNDIRVVLDEPRLFVEESLGSIMVRGEVVVYFTKDTPIQGPIELVFEGIQRFQTWQEIMRFRPLGNPIETKLQVIELSLLPPNSKGVMPAGIQRFPFEFPIPASLPASIFIQDRIEIFYYVSATLRRSHPEQSTTLANWVEKAYRSNQRKKYFHSTPLRIVRPIQSFMSDRSTSEQITNPPQHIPNDNDDNQEALHLPWNRRSLSEYQGFDEQHDQLSSSLAGRGTSNFTSTSESLDKTHGVRYKISVDRIAIVTGTSVGIEVMVKPTECDTKIQSILLNVTENRKYAMKIPADHSWNAYPPEIRRYQESVKMVLKWAYGYQSDGDLFEKKSTKKISSFVHQHSEDDRTMAYFDPPSPGDPNSKVFLNKGSSKEKPLIEREAHAADQNLINLKELNQGVKVGEYFGGRFVMPVPDCSNLLHPSMDYDSIKVSHWLQLTLVLECNGEVFSVHLESPMHMLDCRLVAADDECQTILPPPPSYQIESTYSQQARPASTFWEQRESITSASGWGNCLPCPCELRKIQKEANSYEKAKKNSDVPHIKFLKQTKKTRNTADSCSPSLLPEWGPPPCYSD